MIEGLIGIFLAFVIFISVLFFVKRKPDQKVDYEIKKVMTSLGFINLETSDPKIKEIRKAFRLTTPYPVYLEQVFHRIKDDLIVCWITTNTEGNNNTLVSVIPQKTRTGKWILFNIKSFQGKIANIINKSYELSLSFSNFTKVSSHFFGQSSNYFMLYVYKNDPLPSFKGEFFNVLKKCGDVIIRSSGTITLIERISVVRNETWQKEADDLVRITQLLDKIF